MVCIYGEYIFTLLNFKYFWYLLDCKVRMQMMTGVTGEILWRSRSNSKENSIAWLTKFI